MIAASTHHRSLTGRFDMTGSRFVVVASRVLRYFPSLLLAGLLISGGLIVRDYLAQAPNQFSAIQVADR